MLVAGIEPTTPDYKSGALPNELNQRILKGALNLAPILRRAAEEVRERTLKEPTCGKSLANSCVGYGKPINTTKEVSHHNFRDTCGVPKTTYSLSKQLVLRS